MQPFFARQRLSDIEPPDVRAFVRSLEGRGMKAGSIRKSLAPLEALFATAYEDGGIRGNPTQGVRVVTPAADEDRRSNAMTREELRVLLAALPAEWRPFFTFLAQTGVRISEADSRDLGRLGSREEPARSDRALQGVERQGGFQ